MPFKKLCCCCFTRSGVMEMRASKSCFKQITPRRSSVCGISWFSGSGHKEQKRKICIFCRDRIQLQRRCETLEVCCTDFLEILTYCCCRSYCLNFSHTIKQKFKHCCISNDSLITQARTKQIWLKENLGTAWGSLRNIPSNDSSGIPRSPNKPSVTILPEVYISTVYTLAVVLSSCEISPKSLPFEKAFRALNLLLDSLFLPYTFRRWLF